MNNHVTWIRCFTKNEFVIPLNSALLSMSLSIPHPPPAGADAGEHGGAGSEAAGPAAQGGRAGPLQDSGVAEHAQLVLRASAPQVPSQGLLQTQPHQTGRAPPPAYCAKYPWLGSGFHKGWVKTCHKRVLLGGGENTTAKDKDKSL